MLSKAVFIVLVSAWSCSCFPRLTSFQEPFKYYTRSDWHAVPATDSTPLLTPVPYVVIHHTYKPDACDNHQDCVAAMQSMQRYHMDTMNWDDIGYNFCIGNSGDIYEGRGWELKGIHAGKANGVSIGICLIGDWRVEQPPQQMLEATQALIQMGVAKGMISRNYKLVGHNQVMPTECPGTALFDIISKWDHFSNKFSKAEA